MNRKLFVGSKFENQNHDPIGTVYPAQLLQATRDNNLEKVKELVISAQETNDAELFDFVLAQGLGSKTALDIACENKNSQMIKFLLTICNGEQETLLMAAIDKKDISPLKKIIASLMLLDPIDRFDLLGQQNNFGNTALMIAACNSNGEGVKPILAAMEKAKTALEKLGK